MSSAVFDTIKALEAARVHFFIMRTRPDAITLSATFVGERMEIDIFEDDHIEISRFRGDELIEGGEELLALVLRQEQEGACQPHLPLLSEAQAFALFTSDELLKDGLRPHALMKGLDVN